jgi:1,4-dihydroxy-2-naphthoate octaprenyltransferase
MGLILVIMSHSWWTLLLLGLGVFFVLFYTYPLKYIALGELSVLLVWGPLMIGGGYFVITGVWSWMVVLASLPYALGVTGVIFGKHIDKYEMDKERKIHTLPVVIGERPARYMLVGMLILQYVLVLVMVITGYFTILMAAVLLAIPTFRQIWPCLRSCRRKPAITGCVAELFRSRRIHNRSLGWFMLALIVDLILTAYYLTLLRIPLFK